MKLEDFIKESLCQIIKGVQDAQAFAEQNDAEINSKSLRQKNDTGSYYYDSYDGTPAQVIDFDVAVTTTEQGSSTGKAGIFVSVFGAGIEGMSSAEHLISNRIKFSIPVTLPHGKSKK